MSEFGSSERGVVMLIGLHPRRYAAASDGGLANARLMGVA